MQQPSYWFPAKRFGWGWGLPNTWQGWAVFAAFFALLAAGAVVLLPRQRTVEFLAWALFLAVALVVVCLVKGEPPSWRWGK